VSYDFQVSGWADGAGILYDGAPDVDVSDVFGMWTHWFDEETGDDRYFWAFVDEPFETWGDWLDYIQSIGETEYGLSMA